MSNRMRSLTPMVLAAALVAGSAAAQEMSVRTARTGGLYLPDETVELVVEGAPQGAALHLKVEDYYGQTVIDRAAEGGSPRIAAADVPRLGWHQVTVTAGDASAGTTFAVVPPLPGRVKPEDSAFGVIFSPQGTEAQVADVARSLELAGVGWVDIDIPLAQLAPAEGTFDWTSTGPQGNRPFDAFVRAVDAQGLKLMLKFLGQADWISKRTDEDAHAYWDPTLNLSPPGDPAKWGQVVRAVVGRYGPHAQTWEIGNEPEGHGYFKGTDEEYMAYLEVTANAVRAGQPEARIVAASMYHGGGVLPLLVRRPDLYDVMSVHYLTGPFGAISPLEHYVRALREAGVEKPIWNTESRGRKGSTKPSAGERSHFGGEGADNQSPIKAYVRNFALGIPRVFVFSWNVDEGESLVGPGYAPKWATVEYRTMSDQLGGAAFEREIELHDDVSAFVFRRGDERILVAWTDIGYLKVPLQVAGAGAGARVVDVMGNATPLEGGDAATMTAGYAPVFVTGLTGDARVSLRR